VTMQFIYPVTSNHSVRRSFSAGGANSNHSVRRSFSAGGATWVYKL